MSKEMPSSSSRIDNSLGEYFAELNELDTAYFYFNRALSLALTEDDLATRSSIYSGFGEYHLKNGDYLTAERYLKEAELISDTINDLITYGYSLDHLSDLYMATGEMKKSAIYAHKLFDLREKLLDENLKNKIELHKNKIENVFQKNELLEAQLEKRALENKAIIARNRFIIVISIAAILILSLSYYFFYYFMKTRFRNENLENKIRRIQMNPHFIFNVMGNINALINQDKTELGSRILLKFSQLLRSFLEHSRHDFIPLTEEVKVLERYMKLQQLRFDNPFEYEIKIDIKDSHLIQIHPFIIQPILENAIEHGIKTKKDGKIEIHFEYDPQQMNTVLVSIIDNGQGLIASQQQKSPVHKSMSTAIIEEQLALFSSTKKKFGLTIEERIKGSDVVGVISVIKIPSKQVEE